MIPFHRTAGLAVAVLILSVLVGGTPNALAMPSLVIENGILMGATGVDVGGTLYDVKFMDGTCSALFDGCDATSDFVFQTATHAAAASQALFDQVLLDGPNGLFDTDPERTSGCQNTTGCLILSPFLITTTSVRVSAASNVSPASFGADQIGETNIPTTLNTLLVTNHTWAVWSDHKATVPEPATSVLLTSGLLGIAGYRWRQRRQAGAQVG